jgi:serine/threonine protein kinase
VVGWGEDEEGPFLAVELVEGVSLARLTKTVFDTGEIFGERMVVYVGSQICRGLAAAHELHAPTGEPLGLVHRDLTPGNVLVGFEGRVKITDFGLAKAKQRITKTVTGLLKGRPQYMAPEQARGDAVDARADLFSLGVVLFELFAGRRPWSGATEFEVLSTTQNDPPADLRELRPKIDRELASLVMRLLEKSPDDRFPSAAEVGIRLDEWLAVHGWSDGNDEALARFVRRNAMRQMRWFERAIKGELPMPRRKSRAGSIPSLPETRPSRRERAKRVGEDETEVSLAADASRFASPQRQDTVQGSLDIVDATPAVGRDVPAARAQDFGEEIPTLVQRGDRPLTPGLPAAPSVAPPYDAAGYAIAEEDSDGRTTAVKGRSPAAGMPLHAPMRAAPDEEEDLSDPETETIPVKGPRQAAVKAAMAAARVSALPPPRPPPRPPAGPPGSVAPGSGAPGSGGASPLPPPGPAPTSAPTHPMGASSRSSPPPASSSQLVPPAAARGPWTTDRVVEAADRIAEMAVAAEEEARAAALAAAHKAAVARRIAEAASHAAIAARNATSGGDLVASVRAVEEAERAIGAAQHAEPELPPPVHQPSFVSLPALGRADVPSSLPMAFPPPATQHHPPGENVSGRSGIAPTLGMEVYDPGRPLGVREEVFRAPAPDALSELATRLRPLMMGLPPAMAITIAALALLALLLLVLVIAG